LAPGIIKDIAIKVKAIAHRAGVQINLLIGVLRATPANAWFAVIMNLGKKRVEQYMANRILILCWKMVVFDNLKRGIIIIV
jgi:hypothetical protein